MWTRSRVISLLIVAWYVIFAIYIGDAGTVVMTIAGCALPLACIWFSGAMGQYRGIAAFPKHIDKPSPPSFIFILGWILLLMPVLGFLLILLLQSSE